MKLISDICYAKKENENLLLDIYLPDIDSFPVFIYFHGGGIESGDKKGANLMATDLAKKGICVISANYRMYPGAKYPDFLEDCAEAVKWTYDNIGSYGNAEKIFVGGSSAGGYISQMLCFDERYLSKHGIAPTDIDGFIHDAGQPTVHFNVLRERGIDSRRIIVDDSAPLYHIGRASSYPRMRFIVSDNDMENRFEQTMLTLSTMRHFRYTGFDYVIMRDSKHCSYCGKRDELGESVFGKMIYDFIYAN